MRKRVLLLTTAAGILLCGTIAASAQAPGAVSPGSQQAPTIQPAPGDSTIQDQGSFSGYHGMMGPGMMGHGWMGGTMMDYGHHHWDRGHDIAGPMMMRMIFSLMDADGDGKLTLQEFQAAHERIFKAMDTDHDGTVTLEEMQAFIQGHH
jgi:EF hand